MIVTRTPRAVGSSVLALSTAGVVGASVISLVAAAYVLPFTILLPLALTLPKPTAALLVVGTEAINFLIGMPIWPLQVTLGYLYGASLGFAVALSGYVLSSLAPFLLAPRLLPMVERASQLLRSVLAPLRAHRCAGCCCCTGEQLIRSCEPGSGGLLDGLAMTVEQRPFELTLALRLNLVPPAGLTSYALGAAGVPFATYVLGTALGTVPNTLAYVYLGSLLDSIAAVLAGTSPRFDKSGTALLAGAFAASVVIIAMLSQAAAQRIEAARQRNYEGATSGRVQVQGTACRGGVC